MSGYHREDRRLTPHQIEIVRAVLESASIAEAARQLNLSPCSIRGAVDRAVDRMRVQCIADLRQYVEGTECQKSASGPGARTE